LNEWLPSTTLTNFFLFFSKLKDEHEYSQFGKHLLNYQLKGEEGSPYVIYRVNQDYFLDSKFIE